MGTLRHLRSDLTYRLRPTQVIGRAAESDLRLDSRLVSIPHAVIRWGEKGWELRDLGSRNGTWLDGERLLGGPARQLIHDAQIAFGDQTDTWVVVDTDSPTVMAQSLDGEADVWADDTILGLPSDDDPAVSLFPDADGNWLMERDDQIVGVKDLDVIQVRDRRWRLHLPTSVPETLPGGTAMRPLASILTIGLRLTASATRQDVQLELVCGYRKSDLGIRAHNDLLLALARRRLEHRAGGLVDSVEEGWMTIDELTKRTGLAPAGINVLAHRARRRLEAEGVVGAAALFERRPHSREMRLGIAKLEIIDGYSAP